MTEDELFEGVAGALSLTGWAWLHTRRSDLAQIQGHPHSAGWPDLVAFGHGRVMALELKTQTGSVTPEQWAWLHRMRDAGVDARIIRPSDYDPLIRELTHRPEPSAEDIWAPMDESARTMP